MEFKKEDRLSRQLGSAFWTTGFSISNQIGKLSDCSFFSTLEFRNTQRIDNWLSNLQAIQELKLMHRAELGILHLSSMPAEEHKTKSQYECKKGRFNPRHS